MAKSKKDKKREKRQREWQDAQETFLDFHKKAPYIKRVFRRRGYDLPFYDFYDSYVAEFEKIAVDAKQSFPSLIGIYEVDDKTYYGDGRSQFAPDLDQIFWDMEGDTTEYGITDDGANVNGHTSAFHTKDGEVKTLVFIRQSVQSDQPHREFKYAVKIIALLHELGHVHDIEQSLNFDHKAKKCKITEAEVFAHLYCLERMATMNYYQSFNMLVNAMKQYFTATDYRGRVAKLVLERMPEYKLVDLSGVPLEPCTPEDLEVLGPDGRRAFGLAG